MPLWMKLSPHIILVDFLKLKTVEKDIVANIGEVLQVLKDYTRGKRCTSVVL